MLCEVGGGSVRGSWVEPELEVLSTHTVATQQLETASPTEKRCAEARNQVDENRRSMSIPTADVRRESLPRQVGVPLPNPTSRVSKRPQEKPAKTFRCLPLRGLLRQPDSVRIAFA